jgi:hypothetical protein
MSKQTIKDDDDINSFIDELIHCMQIKGLNVVHESHIMPDGITFYRIYFDPIDTMHTLKFESKPKIEYFVGKVDTEENMRIEADLGNTMFEDIEIDNALQVQITWLNSNPLYRGSGQKLLLFMLCNLFKIFKSNEIIIIELDNDSDDPLFYEKTLHTFQLLEDDGTIKDSQEMNISRKKDILYLIREILLNIIKKDPEFGHCLQHFLESNDFIKSIPIRHSSRIQKKEIKEIIVRPKGGTIKKNKTKRKKINKKSKKSRRYYKSFKRINK